MSAMQGARNSAGNSSSGRTILIEDWSEPSRDRENERREVYISTIQCHVYSVDAITGRCWLTNKPLAVILIWYDIDWHVNFARQHSQPPSTIADCVHQVLSWLVRTCVSHLNDCQSTEPFCSILCVSCLLVSVQFCLLLNFFFITSYGSNVVVSSFCKLLALQVHSKPASCVCLRQL